MNEVFIIGRRENTIDKLFADTHAPTVNNGDEEANQEKVVEQSQDEGKTHVKDEEDKKPDDDFIILFKYDGKAYKCNEKEKTILERQVKILDPTTFRMLLDDFKLEVFAVLNESDASATSEFTKNEDGISTAAENQASEDEELSGSDDEHEVPGEDNKEENKEDQAPLSEATEGETKTAPMKSRRRRRRRGNKNRKKPLEAAPRTPTTPTRTDASRTPQTRGVELGGRVWTRSPASPFTPSKRAQRLAEKNNTMRDTMRQRMQLAYEEEMKKHTDKPLHWKRERQNSGSPQ